MTNVPLHLLAGLLAICVSCSSRAESLVGASDARFAGTWAQREAAAGTSFVLTLAVSGSDVTARGTYTLESGKTGSVTGQGSTSGDRVLLALTCDDGALAQLDGTLAGTSAIQGALHLGPPQSLTPSAIVTFDRKN